MARPTDLKLTRVGTNAVDYEESLPGVPSLQIGPYDGAGNIPAINITLAAGTDHQAFCYDEQNRLINAASTGTVTCQTFSPGTLTAANYNQTFAYDNMGRLTSGPVGAYSYPTSGHIHAATAIGSSYSAAYDAAGDMTCRNTSSTQNSNCSSGGGTVGAVLGYNVGTQLSTWQNQASNPTSTAKFLYDGQGNRVEQVSLAGGTTTATVYSGNFEEDSSSDGARTWTQTTYYYADGQRLALATPGQGYTGGIFYHLVPDLLGSTQLTFDANGNLTAAVLYAPYGTVRYSSASMPTDRGFTGQIADGTSGLDYYNARYYDPTAGQFASADSVLVGAGFDVWGLSRYAYVEGNPVARADPSGHCSSLACWEAVNDQNATQVTGQLNSAGSQAAINVSINAGYQYAQTHHSRTNNNEVPPAVGLALVGTIVANRANGLSWERWLARMYTANGYHVEFANYEWSPMGPRYRDLKIYDQEGNYLGRIEVKQMSSPYPGTMQEVKDAWLSANGEGPTQVVRIRQAGPAPTDPGASVSVEAGFEGLPEGNSGSIEGGGGSFEGPGGGDVGGAGGRAGDDW